MGQVLHGSATTTHAIRALIQRSCASNAALSRELGVNVKTVIKWRKRDRVEDAQMGPKVAHSTVLSIEEDGDRSLPSPHSGPVTVSFRPFESIFCHKGDKPWHYDHLKNSNAMQCALH